MPSVENIQQNYSTIENNLWCVTFQLVWNDFIDKMNNGNPIKFVEGTPKIADELNKKLYTSDILSKDSYYKINAPISKKLKRQIEKSIKKQFNEKSDILDLINWNVKNGYLFYTMLVKNFNFLTPLDVLNEHVFKDSTEKYSYFGIEENSNKKLKENVTVLFYNSNDDFAIKLSTKEKEDIILYRTNKQENFYDIYDFIYKNSKSEKLNQKDTVKIPYLNIDETISYNDLTNKRIEGTDKIISQAIQTIKFKMDNKGGKLKSEAAIAVMRTALLPSDEKPRHFVFDKDFIIFMKEESKDKPYFAARINDTKYLVKK